MTTSEFIIGHSADDVVERKDETRKIFWALLGALIIHLLVGYFIAAFHGVFSSTLPPATEDKPVELTIMNLATPPPVQAAPKKNSMFMETDESKQSPEPPKDPTFESNANSIAASQQPPTGTAPLPSQQGRDRPALDFNTQNYSIAQQGAQPQPSVAPQPSAQPQPSEAPKPTPQASAAPKTEDQLALLTAKPTPKPAPSAAQTPVPPRSVYQPFKEQTRIAGNISNRGISRVNALGTPLGRYEKIIKDSIGSRWYAFFEQKRDLVSIGTLQVHFFIDRSGKVKNLKVRENTSNEAFANICLQSILEANFPPIPEDVAATLPSEGLEIEQMNFTIFPN